MKRLHMSPGVTDRDGSIAFYAGSFGAPPTLDKVGNARSDKTGARDPDGLAWEAFLTRGEADEYGADSALPGEGAAAGSAGPWC